MKKKYKKVYSLAHEPGYRNYTVRDLLDLKGKKKLTQINIRSPEEAAAAVSLGWSQPTGDLRSQAGLKVRRPVPADPHGDTRNPGRRVAASHRHDPRSAGGDPQCQHR